MKRMKIGQRGMHVFALLLSAFFLTGCGAENAAQNEGTPIPAAQAADAGLNVCATCHNAETSKWTLSRHGNAVDSGKYGGLDSELSADLSAGGAPPYNMLALSPVADPTATICRESSGCLCCHDSQGDGRRLSPGYTGNSERPVVGCESCHGPGGGHIAAGGIDLYRVSSSVSSTLSPASSAEFNTCTKCHIPFGPLSDHYPVSNVLTNHAIVTLPADSAFTDSRVNAGSSTAVPLYFVKRYDERACTVCHDPHGHGNINTSYAKSGHGDTTAPSWTDRDWKLSGSRACQRCHTSTGYINLADSPDTYDPTNNLFSHLITNTLSTNPRQMEALYCYACHSYDTAKNGKRVYQGDLRNPGAFIPPRFVAGLVSVETGTTTITGSGTNWTTGNTPPVGGRFQVAGDTETYIVSAVNTSTQQITLTEAYAGATATDKGYEITSYIAPSNRTMPGLAGSYICVSCHSGRNTGELIKSYPLSAATPTLGFFSFYSHYLPAGGVMFRTAGYEYAGRSYSNPGYYMHDKIGTPAISGTGANGPCIGCHMSRPGGSGDHLFQPVDRDSSGNVTAIASEICSTCHGPSPAPLLDLVKERKEEFHEAMEATVYVLDKRGLYYRGVSRYFFQLRTASTATSVAGTVAATSGSAAITGNNTLWTSGTSSIVLGTSPDYFKVDNDGTYYKIVSVATNTSLTLESVYTGATGTNLNYTIIRSGTAGVITNWRTQAGSGLVPAATTDTDTTGNTTGKNNMGAAFNLYFLEHDHGAYAHNRMYAKRLLYDTIDWADDNDMNYSVGDTLNNKIPSGVSFKEGAKHYLLPYGALGNANERP